MHSLKTCVKVIYSKECFQLYQELEVQTNKLSNEIVPLKEGILLKLKFKINASY